MNALTKNNHKVILTKIDYRIPFCYKGYLERVPSMIFSWDKEGKYIRDGETEWDLDMDSINERYLVSHYNNSDGNVIR